MRSQGIRALADEAPGYPTLVVTTSGRGAIGFTRVSENLHPSQRYAPIDDVAGVGPVPMAAEGNAPQDGVTEYEGGRPRWGDYGAAAVDGGHFNLAGQYIERGPRTVADLIANGRESLGTRSTFANWSTRVSKLTL